MAKKTTIDELGEMMTYVVSNMATKDDIRDIRADMATKDDIQTLRTDIAGIREELRDIKQRLKKLEELVSDHAGHSKEIDHALERIAAIERHLGLKPKAHTR